VLEARGLWFRYEAHEPWLFEGIDLRLEPGEVVGLSGSSGSGKTTLGRLLAGYLHPDRGDVWVDEARVVVRARPPGPRPVQLVFQHPELAVDPRWRLAEILAEAGVPDPDLLDELSIARGWLDRYPNELSGGELQRVAVARALLSGARYLIADEVSAMLDPITQAQIWHVLLERVRSGRIGVLPISHDDPLLAAVADRVIDVSSGSQAATLGPPPPARER